MSTLTVSVKNLLAKIGVATDEDLLTSAVANHSKALGVVDLGLWTALQDYAGAEQDYHRALCSLSTDAAKEIKALEDGNSINSTWMTSHAAQATEAGSKMAVAVTTIRAMVQVRKTLV